MKEQVGIALYVFRKSVPLLQINYCAESGLLISLKVARKTSSNYQ